MSSLRPELRQVLSVLLAASEGTRRTDLDAIGAALATSSASTDEIDALMRELEAHGREIAAPSGGGAERHLGSVVAAVRVLKLTLARKPTLAEVAVQAELSVEHVLLALALLRVMQRSPRDMNRS